ncbi:MAG: DUF3857 domain-containing protein [Bacteroidales bacterium]|nr:DUF3857 domain-containing protein [Bacteroidales bacterium]
MNKGFFRLIVLVVVMAAGLVRLNAQSIQIDPKFGKVSQTELAMTSYALDTTASAVYLYKSEVVHINIQDQGFQLRTDYRYRIKILKSDGVDFADFSMDYITARGYEELVSDVKVSTFNLENGKSVETKMSKSYLFNKPVTDDVRRVSFSAQNVKVGSVIEVQFTKLSNDIEMIADMYFQHSIPVNYVNSKLIYPEYFYYSITSRGYNRVESKSTKQGTRISFGGGSLDFDELTEEFTAVNVPAMKKESHVYNRDQFRDAISIDRTNYSIPGETYPSFNKDWSQVDKACRNSKFYTEVISNKSKFKDEVAAAIASEDTDEKKIVAVRNLILKNVEWNDRTALTNINLADAQKNHKGNNAEINCLIGSALNSVGLKTVPVLVKFRSSGLIIDYRVSTDQFDTFILCTTDSSGKRYYFDGAVGEAYLNVLPEDYLVTKARVVDDASGEWVDLSKLTPNVEKINLLLTANVAEGKLEGTLQSVCSGEESYSLKSLYNESGDLDKFAENLENAFNTTIHEIEPRDLSSYGNSSGFRAEISSPMTVSGDQVFINPFIMTMNNDSYFKEEQRTYPFDYPFAEDVKLNVTITIPEDYEFEQIPSDKKFTSGSGIVSSASFVFRQVNESRIQMACSFNIDTVFITVDQYAAMREYWDAVCAEYKEMFILKKK